jgi:hypothetical protein
VHEAASESIPTEAHNVSGIYRVQAGKDRLDFAYHRVFGGKNQDRRQPVDETEVQGFEEFIGCLEWVLLVEVGRRKH